jgi:hypothetical protein
MTFKEFLTEIRISRDPKADIDRLRKVHKIPDSVPDREVMLYVNDLIYKRKGKRI